jgi:3',5'-cyclic AMP phosphodiesterase CpdA
MTKERGSLSKKILLALLIRPPVILILVLLYLLLSGQSGSREVGVDERFALSSSIESPYKNTLKGAHQYSFAFCADPHLRAEGDGCFPDLDQAIREHRINFVIFGGDLTYLGEEHEYRNFVAHVNALTAPSYAALGNHDLYNSGWWYYWKYLGPSSYSFCGGNAKFVVIDSASAEIGAAQMEWIRKELRANTQPLLVVVSHMPIYGGAHDNHHFPRSEERTELIELFEKYEVDYVLEGHYHSYVDMTVNGVRYITSGSFSDGLLNAGDRHFLLFRVYGPSVSVEQVPVGADLAVQYMDDDL